MADPVEQPTPPSSPTAAPASSPEPTPVVIESAPAAQPDQSSAASPAPAAVDTAPPAVGVEATTENAAPAEPVAEPTLLEKFEADKAAKAAAEKPAETKPEEAKPVDKPADETDAPKVDAEGKPELPPIDYFAAETGIKIPDTLKLDDAQRTEVATALDAFRADPSPASAQKIIDMGAKMMTDFAEQTRRDQWKAFNDTRLDWQKQVMADPEMGGNGYDTTMQAVATARDVIASRHKPGTPQYEAEMAEFNNFLKVTGAGDHPAFIRAMRNAARFVGEQTRQPANPGPPPPPKAPRGRASIYDNTKFPT